MGDFMNDVYSPLGREYCFWFYILSVIGFVMMIISVITALYIGMVGKKGMVFYTSMFAISLSYGIFYFQNRLLWSMCSKTL